MSRQSVRSALAARVPIGDVDPFADGYGYMWYTKRYTRGDASITVHFAAGNGGNKIYVIPSERTVVAITSSAYNTTYGQRRSEQILLDLLSMSRPSKTRSLNERRARCSRMKSTKRPPAAAAAIRIIAVIVKVIGSNGESPIIIERSVSLAGRPSGIHQS